MAIFYTNTAEVSTHLSCLPGSGTTAGLTGSVAPSGCGVTGLVAVEGVLPLLPSVYRSRDISGQFNPSSQRAGNHTHATKGRLFHPLALPFLESTSQRPRRNLEILPLLRL